MKNLVFLAICVALFLFVAIWLRRSPEPPYFNAISVDTRLEPISDNAMLDQIARLKAERLKSGRGDREVERHSE